VTGRRRLVDWGRDREDTRLNLKRLETRTDLNMGGYELTILALKKFQCKDYLNWAGLPRRDWGIIGFSEAPPYLAGSFNITSKCPFYAVGNGAGSPLMASPRLFDPHVYKAWKLLKPSLAIPRSIAKAAGGLVTGQARLGSASYHLVQARFHYGFVQL
jgi:hypothetical protein